MSQKGFVWICLVFISLFSISCGQKAEQSVTAQNSQSPSQNSINDISVLQDAKDSRVYLVFQGKRHYIPDPKTLDVLGVKSQIKGANDKEINAISLAEPIPSLSSKFIQKASTGEVFMLEAGKRRYIPDPETLKALHVSKENITGIRDAGVDAIPLGEPVAHKTS